MRALCLALAVASVVPAWAARPACGPDDASAARAAIEAACPCDAAASHGAYVACAVRAARAAVSDPRCVRDVVRCAARSTCGRSGAAICCRTRADGTTHASLVNAADRCRAPHGGSACLSPDPMPCSACVPGGCAAPTAVCGDGVIEPGTVAEPHEQCDGQPICGPSDCLLHAGASCDLGGGYCFGGVPALGLETYWDVGKPCYIIGGTGRAGRCEPVDPSSCPPPPPGVTLPPFIICGTIVDEPLPSTTLCCQHADGTCNDGPVASDSQAQSFPCDLLPFGTDLLLVGTCGAGGRCVPAS